MSLAFATYSLKDDVLMGFWLTGLFSTTACLKLLQNGVFFNSNIARYMMMTESSKKKICLCSEGRENKQTIKPVRVELR